MRSIMNRVKSLIMNDLPHIKQKEDNAMDALEQRLIFEHSFIHVPLMDYLNKFNVTRDLIEKECEQKLIPAYKAGGDWVLLVCSLPVDLQTEVDNNEGFQQLIRAWAWEEVEEEKEKRKNSPGNGHKSMTNDSNSNTDTKESAVSQKQNKQNKEANNNQTKQESQVSNQEKKDKLNQLGISIDDLTAFYKNSGPEGRAKFVQTLQKDVIGEQILADMVRTALEAEKSPLKSELAKINQETTFQKVEKWTIRAVAAGGFLLLLVEGIRFLLGYDGLVMNFKGKAPEVQNGISKSSQNQVHA